LLKEEINRALENPTKTIPWELFSELVGNLNEIEVEKNAIERYAQQTSMTKKKELEEHRLREDQLTSQLNRLQNELAENQQREHERYEQQKKLESQARERENEQRAMIARLEHEREVFNRIRIEETEKLNKQKQEFEEERARYTQESKEKLEANTSAFVEGILIKLEEKENRMSRISFWAAIFGGAILIIGLMSLIYLSFRSDLLALGQMTWPQIVYFATKGAVIAGVIGVISRYSYVFSIHYQKEALRVADKSHAIKFGQLYVETYGAAADWDRVKDAFANWHGAAEVQEQAQTRDDNELLLENTKQIKDALDLIGKLKSVIKQ